MTNNLPSNNFAEYNPVAKYIRCLIIVFSFQAFRGHPVRGSHLEKINTGVINITYKGGGIVNTFCKGNPLRENKYRGYKQHIKGGGNIDITSSQGEPT